MKHLLRNDHVRATPTEVEVRFSAEGSQTLGSEEDLELIWSSAIPGYDEARLHFAAMVPLRTGGGAVDVRELSLPHRFSGPPKLIEVETALMGLDSVFEKFAAAHAFRFSRGDSATHNTPRRMLRKRGEICSQGIDLVFAIPMLQRMEREFYPSIPCKICITVHNHEKRKVYFATVCEVSFEELRAGLANYLAAAKAKLDEWTLEFLRDHGAEYLYQPKQP